MPSETGATAFGRSQYRAAKVTAGSGAIGVGDAVVVPLIPGGAVKRVRHRRCGAAACCRFDPASLLAPIFTFDVRSHRTASNLA
ncbi:MAG: hypothetical protein ACLQOO_06905 [Terriglobia bacterium]